MTNLYSLLKLAHWTVQAKSHAQTVTIIYFPHFEFIATVLCLVSQNSVVVFSPHAHQLVWEKERDNLQGLQCKENRRKDLHNTRKIMSKRGHEVACVGGSMRLGRWPQVLHIYKKLWNEHRLPQKKNKICKDITASVERGIQWETATRERKSLSIHTEKKTRAMLKSNTEKLLKKQGSKSASPVSSQSFKIKPEVLAYYLLEWCCGSFSSQGG